MFTGFASENTPAIQVWDFFRPFASTSAYRQVGLADDCAPIQFFRTGAASNEIQVYLPTAPIEGKQIKIINSRYAANAQRLLIVASDANQNGTFSIVAYIGPGQTIDFCYSKNCISFGVSAGTAATGWISLNQSFVGSPNAHSVVSGGLNSAAIGVSSFVGGGDTCLASGGQSFSGGGSSNTASSSNAAVVGGNSSTASGSSSAVVGGSSNTASGGYSAVLSGSFNTSGGFYSVVSGYSNSANSDYSAVIGGSSGSTKSIRGNLVFPASNEPISPILGVQQLGTLLLGRQTTNATATVLTSNTSAAATTNQVILPNNSAYTFQGTCIANVTGGGTTSGWKFEGVIKRGANAASTTLVAAVTPTVIAQDAGASTWVLAITADTTNGGIKVEVTGAAATTIRWVVKIETTEVTF